MSSGGWSTNHFSRKKERKERKIKDPGVVMVAVLVDSSFIHGYVH